MHHEGEASEQAEEGEESVDRNQQVERSPSQNEAFAKYMQPNGNVGQGNSQR